MCSSTVSPSPIRPASSAVTLESLSFQVKAGETVAIVGPSGAGKSTVLSLLLRFYDPTSGAIGGMGFDLRQARLAELRARMAIVRRMWTIFAASIHDNIAFGCQRQPRGRAAGSHCRAGR